MRHSPTLEVGKGHLASWWAHTQVNDPMKSKASEILGRPGFIRVCDILSSFHIQKQGGIPGRGITWLLLWICTKMIRALVIRLLASAREADFKKKKASLNEVARM